MRRISVKLWVPVTSQLRALHHCFQSASISLFSREFVVFACSVNPDPTTFLLYAPRTEFMMSLFRSRSRARAFT